MQSDEFDQFHNICFTSDILPILEKRLDLSQKVSLVFLLYDDYTEVYQQIIDVTNVYGSGNYELLETDFLKSWVTRCPTNWKEKLVEALLIIQAFKDIQMLGLDLSSAWNFFLPKCPRYSVFVHLLKKVLYFTSDFLVTTVRHNLVRILSGTFKSKQGSEPFYWVKYFELFLMKMSVEGKIRFRSPIKCFDAEDNQSDLANLTKHIPPIIEICNHLISIENLPNSSINSTTENENECQKMLKHHAGVLSPSTFSDVSLNINLSFNTLRYLEKTLCLREKISLSFLLYENFMDLEKLLLFTKSPQTLKKTASEFQLFDDSLHLLHNFLQSSSNNQKEKILEALLIIHANAQINTLNISTLKVCYIFPEYLQTSIYIHPYKKALYAVCESLNSSDRRKIISAVNEERKDEKHKIITNDIDLLYFEMFLFKLAMVRFISFSSWQLEDSYSQNIGNSNVRKFSSVLKKLGYHYQYNILESCQFKFDKINVTNEISTSLNDDALSTPNNDKMAIAKHIHSKGASYSPKQVKRNTSRYKLPTKKDITTFVVSANSCYSLSITLLHNLDGLLKMDECFSLVFLLYEDFKKAIDRLKLSNRIDKMTKCVTDSLKCHQYNVRLFSDYNHSEVDFWREKLLEGCFIIKNQGVLDLLGIDMNNENFLSKDSPLTYFIHPVKRILLKICQILTASSKTEIINAITQELGTSIKTDEQIHIKYFELFLLKLLNENYITLGTWLPDADVFSKMSHLSYSKTNVGNLAAHLKKFIDEDLYDSLRETENSVNNLLDGNYKMMAEKYQPSTLTRREDYSVMRKIKDINALHRNDAFESLLIIKGRDVVFSSDTEQAMIFLLDDRKACPHNFGSFGSSLDNWALDYGKYWKDKLYETFFITKINTHYLNLLNVDFTLFKNLFSPNSIEVSLLVHPVKKALYVILQSISMDDKSELFTLLFHQNIDPKSVNHGNFFMALTNLIDRDLITLGSWIEKNSLIVNKFVPSNIHHFGEHLKALDLYYHYYILKSSEILVNRQSLDIVDEGDLHDIEKLIEYNSDKDVISQEIIDDIEFTLHSNYELMLYDEISLLFLIFETQEDYQRIEIFTDLIMERESLKDENIIPNMMCFKGGKSKCLKEKLIEAFLIVRPSCMTEQKNLTALHNYYLPTYLNKSKTIHPVKKTLHAMCEAIDTRDRLKIIQSISNDDKFSIPSDSFDIKYFELYLIKLINQGFITLGPWKQDGEDKECSVSNVRNLAFHLMKTNLKTWCNKLMSSEKIANEECGKNIDDILRYIADEAGIYPIDPKNPGIVVIINQKKFYTFDESLNKIESLKFRKGSDNDRDNLKTLWGSLGFRVIVFEDLEKNDIIPKITETLLTTFMEGHGAFVLCLLSHGEKGAIYGSDTLPIGVNEIVTSLDSFKMLKGKPKIIIIQSCQGNQNLSSVTIESDSSNMSRMSDDQFDELPHVDDLLVFWSTIPGHLSYRDDDGTWFIKAFCLNLERSGHLKSFLDICIDVNSDLISFRRGGFIQMSKFSFTLKKPLYFEKLAQSENC